MFSAIRASRLFVHPIPFYVARRLVATATRNTGSLIPIIDFTQFREAVERSERKHVADKIVSAFEKSGFIYLSGHGIPASTIQDVFAKSAKFFALPLETKEKLSWTDARSNRGYVTVGRERVTQSADPAEVAALRAKAPDSKESMEIGRDWDAEWKNQWPQEADVPEFKRTMLDFYQTCHNLHVYVMRSIALGLDLEEDFFDKKIDEQYHNLRLLLYPPIKRSLQSEGQARAASHSGLFIELTNCSGLMGLTVTDYGTLTLLFQDSVGGLEIQNPHTGKFVPVTPIPGTIVINVGDLLTRWSNDILCSTLHRVVAPPTKQIDDAEAITPARQSIAFFCRPNPSAEVACLPNCGAMAKYPPVNAGEYVLRRLSVTYTRE